MLLYFAAAAETFQEAGSLSQTDTSNVLALTEPKRAPSDSGTLSTGGTNTTQACPDAVLNANAAGKLGQTTSAVSATRSDVVVTQSMVENTNAASKQSQTTGGIIPTTPKIADNLNLADNSKATNSVTATNNTKEGTSSKQAIHSNARRRPNTPGTSQPKTIDPVEAVVTLESQSMVLGKLNSFVEGIPPENVKTEHLRAIKDGIRTLITFTKNLKSEITPLAKLNRQIKTLTDEKTSLTASLEKTKEDLKYWKGHVSSTANNQRDKITKYELQIQIDLDEIKSLTKTVESQELHLAKATADLQTCNGQYAQTLLKLEDAENKLAASNDQNARLQEQIQRLEQTAQARNSAMAEDELRKQQDTIFTRERTVAIVAVVLLVAVCVVSCLRERARARAACVAVTAAAAPAAVVVEHPVNQQEEGKASLA